MTKQGKKKVYILYPDGILSYSPTVLNLYDTLAAEFDVTVFSYEPDKYFTNERPDNRNVFYIKKAKFVERVIYATSYFLGRNLFGLPKMGKFRFKRQAKLYLHLKFREKADAIIAVDLSSVWVAQKISDNVHLVSLEIYENDPFLASIRKEKIRSVIIQSKIRYRYYFPDEDVRVFYVQNSPIFRTFEPPQERKGLLYNGTAVPEFGIIQCVNFIKHFKEFSLTIKGAVPDAIKKIIEAEYGDLLRTKNIIIDKTYVESSQLGQYISQFRIGFCFYDLSFEKINTFNYITAPSGKLFAYLAAGVPVIGNKIQGLHIVEDNNCGILVDDMTPENILSAIQKIESNYEVISGNCVRTAAEYSFDKKIAPFIEFLRQTV